MKIKHNTSIVGCRPEILIAAISVIEPLYAEYGIECVITSGTEKYKHSVKRSAHYRGDALDFRTRDFKSTDDKLKFYEDLALDLGSNFVCVLEKTHLHVHWSPIYG